MTSDRRVAMTSDRRRFLGAAAGAIATTGATLRQLWPKRPCRYDGGSDHCVRMRRIGEGNICARSTE
jgi:hypothetical protein